MLFFTGETSSGGLDASHGLVALIVGALSAGLPIVLKFLLAKRKVDVDHDMAVRNKIYEEYQDIVDKLTLRVVKLEADIKSVLDENVKYRSENAKLTEQLSNLREEVINLQKDSIEGIGTHDAIVMTDADLNILQWDTKAALLLQYMDEEAKGMKFTQLFASQTSELPTVLAKIRGHIIKQSAIITRLRTKGGNEVSATIYVRGWQLGDPSTWYFGMSIRLI